MLAQEQIALIFPYILVAYRLCPMAFFERWFTEFIKKIYTIIFANVLLYRYIYKNLIYEKSYFIHSFMLNYYRCV